MGQLISNRSSNFLDKENVRIMMVGLGGAGKTTILYQLKEGKLISTIRTIGFNVEIIEYKNIRFTVWEAGGQTLTRQLWYHFFKNTAALIYVVDSTDVERIPVVAEELHAMLESPELQNAVVLVLANKQDLPNALNTTELVQRLELHKIKHDWHVHSTCATSGNGIYESLEELHQMLEKRRNNK